MKRKATAEYVVEVNGTPDYAKIPKPVLESVAKKFLENILKWQKEKDEGINLWKRYGTAATNLSVGWIRQGEW